MNQENVRNNHGSSSFDDENLTKSPMKTSGTTNIQRPKTSAISSSASSGVDRTELQKKTFTRWVNSYLIKRGMQVDDIQEDFADGTKLANFLELLSQEEMPRYNRNPKIEIQMLENLNTCLQFIKDHSIQLVNIGSKDIQSRNLKLILGLLWTLILRWEVTTEDGKAGLLLWVQRSCRNYPGIDPPNVENFTLSWSNGLPFCALIHKFRPNLINYNSLDPNEAIGNCTIAFKIAEEELGIASLLDPADVVNTPDEKSIIAYVSQYFKKFAQSSKHAALLKSLRNAFEVTKRHDDWIRQYLSDADSLKEWIARQIEYFSSPEESTTSEEVKVKVDSFSTYVSNEKPEWQSRMASLEGVFNTLSNSKKNNGRPDFDPPLSVAEIRKSWDMLQETEQAYEKKILEKSMRFQEIDHRVTQFNTKSHAVENWLSERKSWFDSCDVGSSVSEIERNIELHSSFESRLEQYKAVIDELKKSAEAIISLSHGEHGAENGVRQNLKSVEDLFGDVSRLGNEHRTVLAEALESKKKQDHLERNFLIIADAVQFELDQVNETANAEIVVTSSQELESLKTDCDHASERLNAIADKLEELGQVASEIREDRKAEFIEMVEKYNSRTDSIRKELNERSERLNELESVQQRKEELRQNFATKANWLAGECGTLKSKLMVSGGLEKQLEDIRALRSEVDALGQSSMKELEELAAQCEQEDVIGNAYTPHTVNSLRVMIDQLRKSCENTEQSINAQIMAKKSLEVSPEQLQEIREVFAFFDQDNSGFLDKQELKEACTGAGIDLDEAEIERRADAANTGGKVDLDFFTNLMLEQMKTGDTKEEVLSALRKLGSSSESGGSATEVNAGQILEAVQNEPELYDYLSSKLESNDLENLVEELFSR